MSCVLQQREMVLVCHLQCHPMLAVVHSVNPSVSHHARNAAVKSLTQAGNHVSLCCVHYISIRLCTRVNIDRGVFIECLSHFTLRFLLVYPTTLQKKSLKWICNTVSLLHDLSIFVSLTQKDVCNFTGLSLLVLQCLFQDSNMRLYKSCAL